MKSEEWPSAGSGTAMKNETASMVEWVEEKVEEDPESAKYESFISHHRLPKGMLMNIIMCLSIACGLNPRLLNLMDT